MRTIAEINYREQELIQKEWTTWNGKISSGWGWMPSRELRQEMPWLPISEPASTAEELMAKIDGYLDNVEKHKDYHNTIINATAEWCAKYGSE